MLGFLEMVHVLPRLQRPKVGLHRHVVPNTYLKNPRSFHDVVVVVVFVVVVVVAAAAAAVMV
jgi:hypothetical protein